MSVIPSPDQTVHIVNCKQQINKNQQNIKCISCKKTIIESAIKFMPELGIKSIIGSAGAA